MWRCIFLICFIVFVHSRTGQIICFNSSLNIAQVENAQPILWIALLQHDELKFLPMLNLVQHGNNQLLQQLQSWRLNFLAFLERCQEWNLRQCLGRSLRCDLTFFWGVIFSRYWKTVSSLPSLSRTFPLFKICAIIFGSASLSWLELFVICDLIPFTKNWSAWLSWSFYKAIVRSREFNTIRHFVWKIQQRNVLQTVNWHFRTSIFYLYHYIMNF